MAEILGAPSSDLALGTWILHTSGTKAPDPAPLGVLLDPEPHAIQQVVEMPEGAPELPKGRIPYIGDLNVGTTDDK